MEIEKEQSWLQLIEFCEKNRYIVFDKLEIKDGAPVLGSIARPITNVTTAYVSVKFNQKSVQ